MNTPVEVDIYAHANSTCVMGSRMLNEFGGSADLIRSANYSIMHTPSTRPSKADPTGVSCIVPMCTHVDQTERDLDAIVTEIVSRPALVHGGSALQCSWHYLKQGLADVRGMSPRERARKIIKDCAHPDYILFLQDYFDKAECECWKQGWGHEPQSLLNSFDMHKNLVENGTMKISGWK